MSRSMLRTSIACVALLSQAFITGCSSEPIIHISVTGKPSGVERLRIRTDVNGYDGLYNPEQCLSKGTFQLSIHLPAGLTGEVRADPFGRSIPPKPPVLFSITGRDHEGCATATEYLYTTVPDGLRKWMEYQITLEGHKQSCVDNASDPCDESCGAHQRACCTGNVCTAGLICGAAKLCESCGALNQACCPTGDGCQAGFACLGSSCQSPCSKIGEVRASDEAVCAPVINGPPTELHYRSGDFFVVWQTGGGTCLFIETRNAGGAENQIANPSKENTVYEGRLEGGTQRVIVYGCSATPTIYVAGRRGSRVLNAMQVGTSAQIGAEVSL